MEPPITAKLSKRRKILIAIAAIVALMFVRYAFVAHAKNSLDSFSWEEDKKLGEVSQSGEVGGKLTVSFGPRSSVDEAVSTATPLFPPCSSYSEKQIITQSFTDSNGVTPLPCSGVLYSWVFKPGRRQLALIYMSKLQMSRATGKMISVQVAADSFCKSYPTYCSASSSMDTSNDVYDEDPN